MSFEAGYDYLSRDDTYAVPKPGNIGLSYHYLAIATKLQDIGSTLGHELEIQGSWTFLKDVTLSMGMSYMVGTKNMQLLKRASEDGRLFWAWISLQAAPRLLNYKW